MACVWHKLSLWLRLVIFVYVEQEQMLGVVVLMLELDVLVQRPLRPIRFIALVNRTRVMPRDLHSSPPHPLLSLLLPRLRDLTRRTAVTAPILCTLNPQIATQRLNLASHCMHLDREIRTWAILVRTCWCSLAAYR